MNNQIILKQRLRGGVNLLRSQSPLQSNCARLAQTTPPTKRTTTKTRPRPRVEIKGDEHTKTNESLRLLMPKMLVQIIKSRVHPPEMARLMELKKKARAPVSSSATVAGVATIIDHRRLQPHLSSSSNNRSRFPVKECKQQPLRRKKMLILLLETRVVVAAVDPIISVAAQKMATLPRQTQMTSG